MSTKKSHADTQADLALHYNVARQTAAGWAQYPDFPRKTKKGYSLARVDAWLKKKHLGPYRSEGVMATDGLTLTEAKIQRLAKQTERDQIAIELESIELERMRGMILLADDVRQQHQRIAATAAMELTSLRDAIDREAPLSVPTAEAWPETRERLLAAADRIARNAMGAIEEFLAGMGDGDQ